MHTRKRPHPRLPPEEPDGMQRDGGVQVFKPAVMYSSTSTRQIFERLAHSSIMRLSESR